MFEAGRCRSTGSSLVRMASPRDAKRGSGLTRRDLVIGAGAGVAGVGLGEIGRQQPHREVAQRPIADTDVPFWGTRQAGITTPPQSHIHVEAFDFTGQSATELRDLLHAWTETAARLTTGRKVGPRPRGDAPPTDPGEATDLGPNRLTVTIGFGPTLFEDGDRDRLGLAATRPAPLAKLPRFPGEALEPRRSGGDLCIQACADSPQVAFHAIHTLADTGAGVVAHRWGQAGFRPGTDLSGPIRTRNLFGFTDGTNNIALDDPDALSNYVWVGPEGPKWMHEGTYLVIRRIRMLFDVWDPTTLDGQERVIGRHKESGAPLGQTSETEPPDLSATAIPANAHIRVASPKNNADQRLLRRSYAFNDGIDADTDQIDAGLLFACFQRDPRRQFTRIQQQLATHDALSRHTLHTGSALFACPPGARRGGFVGESLLRGL